MNRKLQGATDRRAQLVVSCEPPRSPGARLEANYPVSVITDGMGLNITVMSYRGHMDFGIVADRDQMKDVWCLLDWLSDELDQLRPTRTGPPAAEPVPHV